MSSYLDTSVLVRALTREAGAEAVARWLLAHRSDRPAVSDWTLAEFSSALALKLRSGQIDEAIRSAAHDALAARVAVQFTLWAVHRSDFNRAAQLGGRPELKLRGSDALHLAIALERSAILVTADHRLADAAKAVACPVERF